MKRWNCVLICLTILFQSCKGQNAPQREIFNKEFNWRITIPENFRNVSAEQWSVYQSKGAVAVEKTFGEEVVNQSSIIFVFQSDDLNYFESNQQPFDTAVDGNYLESCSNVNMILYQTFVTQAPGIVIDTISSVEKIDHLEFQVFKLKVEYPNKLVLNTIMFSRLFGKKEFSVNIMYVDDSKGKQMLEAWRKSKFALSQ